MQRKKERKSREASNRSTYEKCFNFKVFFYLLIIIILFLLFLIPFFFPQ